MDNYDVHKRVEARDWLEADPRVRVHFTPNLGVVAEPAIHRAAACRLSRNSPG